MASNSVISLGIQVDGENTFKSALSAIDAEIKSLGAGVQAATASMGAMGDSEEAAAKKAELMGKQVDANEQKLKILSQQYENANKRLEELGKALEEAKKSGDPEAIEKATNAYNKQSVQVSKLSTEMSKTETAISKTKQEMAKSNETTEKSGSLWEKLKESLGNVSQAAKQMTLQSVSESLGKINGAIDAGIEKLKSFGLAVWNAGKEASVMADDLLTLSATSNVSAENLQKWEYASRFIDTSVSTLTGSVKKLQTNMTSGNKSASEAMERLGVSARDASGNFRSAEDVMWDAIDALSGIENEAERDALAMALFGKSANELNPVISSGSKAFKQLGDDAQKAGLILTDEGVNSLGNFNDGLQKMEATFAGVKNQILSALAPAFTLISEKITGVAQRIAEWVQTDEAQQMLSNIADTVMELVEALASNLEPIIQGVIKAFSAVSGVIQFVANNLDIIIPIVGALAAALVALKVAQLAVNIAMMANPIGAVIAAVTAAIAAVAALATVIVKNWEGIKSFFQGAGESIGNAFSRAKDAVVNAWQNVPEFFANVKDKVKGAWQGIDGFMTDKFGAAWEGIKKAFTPFVDFFKQKWESVKTIFSAVGDVLHGNFSGAWEKIKSVFVGWGDYFKGLWDTIVKGFGELPKKIVSIGRDIVTGLWEGIKNAADWLWKQLTGWVDGIVGGIKGLLGIKSPSKVFKDEVGLMIGLGVAEGIESSAAAVQKAYTDMLPDPAHITASVDGLTVAARVASGSSGGKDAAGMFQDNRPIILTLNDRELGRAVRGYV